MGVSATLLAEHRSRKAVGAPPLKWIRHATLAHCRSPGTLRIEEATQVGANPRNKLFHIGALGLRAASHTAEEGHAGELTLLCSGMTGSSIQTVSLTSMDGGVGFMQYCLVVIHLHSDSVYPLHLPTC